MDGSSNANQNVVGLAEILTLSDRAFVRAVKRILEPLPEPAWMMSVVAYQNLDAFMQSVPDLAKDYPDPEVPSDLDGLIRFLGKNMLKGTAESGGRRMAWFFHAAIVKRATEIASQNPALHGEVAAIWIMLAQGSAFLGELLTQNVLWSAHETAPFEAIRNQRDGIHYCLNILAPAYLREGNHLAPFAESCGVGLLPK